MNLPEKAAMTAFMSAYEPAKTPEEATDLVSTSELVKMFLTVSKICPEELSDRMLDSGYMLHCVNLELLWMLKSKAG